MITALLDLEADTCPGCGLPKSQTMVRKGDNPEAELQRNLDAYWKQFPSQRFFAGFTVCGACEALGRAQREQQKKDEQAEKDGATVIPESRYWTVYANPNLIN